MARAGTTTALANNDETLRALALMSQKTAKARAAGVAKTIGTEGARFKIDGKLVKDTYMDVVITDFILANTLYRPGTAYDSKNPASPICFAFGREDGEMVAHPDALAPQGGTKYEPKGGEAGRPCDGCWAQEWESAEKGKGKACKQGMRVGLIAASDIKSAESVERAEVRFLPIPVMSTRNLSAHVDEVSETFGKSFLEVVTKIEIVPGTGEGDSKGGGHSLEFSTVQEIDKKMMTPLIEKHQATAKAIDYAYPKFDDSKTQPRGGGRTPSAPARDKPRASSKGVAEQVQKRTTKY